MEWIKTSDRLPEPWITVLVSGGIAYHNPEANTWHSRTGNDTGKIIEWPVNDWAVLPSPYDLPEEIDITKTMYPSDMVKAGKCVNPSDGKICELPAGTWTGHCHECGMPILAGVFCMSCKDSEKWMRAALAADEPKRTCTLPFSPEDVKNGLPVQLPKPPTTLEAQAIILAAEALIRALSCMTSNYDNGRSKAIATIGEALLHDAKEAGIL